MKHLVLMMTILMGGTVFSADKAEGLKSQDFVSPMNFQMPALEVITSDDSDEVSLVIKGALLFYPEDGSNNDFKLMSELMEFFDFGRLNSVIVTVNKEDCQTQEIAGSDIQLFRCQAHHPKTTTIQGANSLYQGGMDGKSDAIHTLHNFSIELKHVTEQGVGSLQERVQVQLYGTMKNDNGETKGLHSLKKSITHRRH